MAISAKDVMELRKQTDCGMMECKKALTQADGDFEKAIEILREQGLAAANKKAGRIAAEGMVYAVSFDNCAVVVEVNAETDFVAKNDKFVDFTKNLAKVVADENPADVEALMACKMGDGTVDDALKALILVIKENIKVRRFARYEGHCAAYVHGGGTHGVIVKFETSDDVAAKPEFAALCREHNDANVITLSGRFVPLEENERILDTFFATDFGGGRHAGRVEKIMALETPSA